MLATLNNEGWVLRSVVVCPVILAVVPSLRYDNPNATVAVLAINAELSMSALLMVNVAVLPDRLGNVVTLTPLMLIKSPSCVLNVAPDVILISKNALLVITALSVLATP